MATNHLPAVRNSNVDLRKGTPRTKRVPVDNSMPDVCHGIYAGSADLLDGLLSFFGAFVYIRWIESILRWLFEKAILYAV